MRQLTLPDLGIRFIFPHAPMMPVTINGGFVMRAWYDILDAGLALKEEDERGLRASEERLPLWWIRKSAAVFPLRASCWPGFLKALQSRCRPGLRYPRKAGHSRHGPVPGD